MEAADNAANVTEIDREEAEMRKIKNTQIHTANPGLFFARGVEQLVSDGLYRPANADAQHQRREAPTRKAEQATAKGNFFSAFLSQYVY